MRTAKTKRRPSAKRDHPTVQLDVRELNLHRDGISIGEYEAKVQPKTKFDDRPRLALAIRHVSPEELERLSRFPR